jgi:hypothetical protein
MCPYSGTDAVSPNAGTICGVCGNPPGYCMHWQKDLAYTITPKSGPMRRMETLLDANRAFAQDLPRALFKKPDWIRVGRLLVQAAETGRPVDIQEATQELVEIIDRHGWMEARHADG